MSQRSYAELLLDTARTPVVLGTRGAECDGRQLLFRHDGYQVDVMVQEAGRTGRFLWGQVVVTLSGRPCEGAAITFVDAQERVHSTTTTDGFGEFSLAVPAATEGGLNVDVAGRWFLCWLAPQEAPAERPVRRSARG